MEYIDFHTHIFPEKIADKALGKLAAISGIVPCTKGTLEDTVRQMKASGIDRFVCLNIATAPGQETTINNAAAEVTETYRERILSLGSVHYRSENVLTELDRIKSLGIPGIKLHPDYQEFMIDDKALYPIYDRCAELGLFIIFHAGWDCYSPSLIHALPEASANVAKAFPALKMVLAHLGGLRLWEDVEQHLTGLENVYMDTAICASYGLDPDFAARIMKKHPEENIFLGSDCPWERPDQSVRYIETLPLSDDRKEKIFYRNAIRFLGWN